MFQVAHNATLCAAYTMEAGAKMLNARLNMIRMILQNPNTHAAMGVAHEVLVCLRSQIISPVPLSAVHAAPIKECFSLWRVETKRSDSSRSAKERNTQMRPLIATLNQFAALDALASLVPVFAAFRTCQLLSARANTPQP